MVLQMSSKKQRKEEYLFSRSQSKILWSMFISQFFLQSVPAHFYSTELHFTFSAQGSAGSQLVNRMHFYTLLTGTKHVAIPFARGCLSHPDGFFFVQVAIPLTIVASGRRLKVIILCIS
jgi:hypothetical protein